MKKSILALLAFVLLLGCGKKTSLTEEEITTYTEKGKAISQATFMALSTQLKQAMQSGGVEQAAQFCNIVALPLTDSLSRQQNAVIKRTSLKLRNPLNAPDSMEIVMLEMYDMMSKMRNPVLVPKILEKNADEIQFFAPIQIKNETCLKCHGVLGQTMSEEDYAFIKQHYPNDQATGYKMDDVRGMWSITLKR
ncbi:MAG: DUF3365 domain-containing protein [Cyclobacteriaceae bacterium]|nr:DUF3365 domain-containing protein [Cyclobacteriaceae bacterium]